MARQTRTGSSALAGSSGSGGAGGIEALPTSLREVGAELRAKLMVTRLIGQERLSEAMAPLRDAAHVRRVAELALGDELPAIAARSYAHVNGFDKLVLISSSQPEFELRLHVWWPEETESPAWGGAFRTHNHRWDYSSFLATGHLRLQHFEVSSSGPGRRLHAYQYFTPARSSHYEMRWIGRAYLRPVLDVRIRAGDYYALSHAIQHGVTADRKGLAASLLLRGPSLTPETRVYTERKVPRAHHIEVKRLTPAQTAAILERFCALLEEA